MSRAALRPLARCASTSTARFVRCASSTPRDAHAVLGVARGASESEVKAAYRELALKTHPDLQRPEERAAAELAFKEVSEAFKQLTDPQDVRRTPHSAAAMTREEAERLFTDILGPDGDFQLAWRVAGRRAPQKPKKWQEYQAMIEADAGSERIASGREARALYRDCLRALRGIDAATAAGVREEARSLFAASAEETGLAALRMLLVDGRHSLDELIKCLDTAGAAAAPVPPGPEGEPRGSR